MTSPTSTEAVTLRDHEKSLSAIIGKKIVEVAGYPSNEFGDDTLVFKITRIIFENGFALGVAGKHGMPYVPNDEEMQEILELHYKADEDEDEDPKL